MARVAINEPTGPATLGPRVCGQQGRRVTFPPGPDNERRSYSNSFLLCTRHLSPSGRGADGRPMILRRLHDRVSRLSLASAALLGAAPRALPSAGLFRARGLHGAAGDGASSEHGRKPAGTSSSSSSSRC